MVLDLLVLQRTRGVDAVDEPLLRDLLHVDVDRELDVVADGSRIDLDRRADLPAPRIDLHGLAPSLAPQHRLVRRLHPAATDEVAPLIALPLQFLELCLALRAYL